MNSTPLLNKLFSLSGRVALVTGGGQGIGKSVARGLAGCGANVTICDLNYQLAKETSEEINDEFQDSNRTFPIEADVTKVASIENMVNSTVSHYNGLHIAFNNAGIAISSEKNASESAVDESQWDKTMDINLKAVFFCCQKEAQYMIKNNNKYGRIINTASMSGTIVNWPQKQSLYNTSKAGVVHMTKSLAVEWCKYNITVNALSPGYINTKLNQQESIAHLREIWKKDTPMNKLGEPDELVTSVIYLASEHSSFTTGLDMIVDGGFTLW